MCGFRGIGLQGLVVCAVLSGAGASTLAQEPPYLWIELQGGTRDAATETRLVEALRGLTRPRDGDLKIRYESVGADIQVVATVTSRRGDLMYVSRGVWPRTYLAPPPGFTRWIEDLERSLRDIETAAAHRERLAIDWIRATFWVGTTGGVGGGGSLVTLKWDHAYLVAAKGGAVLGGWNERLKAYYLFAGPEAGWLRRNGPHWFSVGVQVGFGVLHGGTQTAASRDQYDNLPRIMGGMVSPTLRYRRYWGRFGLEVSLEWPVVFSKAGLGTPWPILGIGIGL